MSKQKSGFTIIETMLFLAITGLVFAGVVIGTNGSLRSQRYRDTVQSFVNSLRDVYSRAENTEITDYGNQQARCGWWNNKTSDISDVNSARGRSRCVVYGLAVAIYTDNNNESYVMSSLLGGFDEAQTKENLKSTDSSPYDDLLYLKHAGVSEFFTYDAGPSYRWERKGEVKSKLLWGAKVHVLCSQDMVDSGSYDSCKSTDDIADNIGVEMIVYRSPNTGSIESFARYAGNGIINPIAGKSSTTNANDSLVEFDDGIAGEATKLKHRDVSFCIEPGDGMSSSGGMRMVTIDGDASGENAVRLIEADSEKNRCNN